MDDLRLFPIAPILGLTLAWVSPTHAEDLRPCENWWAKEEAPAPEEGQQWTFVVAPYIHHWSSDPEHKHAFIFALERRVAGDRLCGVSLFRNSFGQPSGYVYLGQRWDNLGGNPHLSAKLTAGVIYGYKHKYRDKVPLNWRGFSPTIIPSLGYQFNRQDSLDVMTLGTAAVAFSYSHNF